MWDENGLFHLREGVEDQSPNPAEDFQLRLHFLCRCVRSVGLSIRRTAPVVPIRSQVKTIQYKRVTVDFAESGQRGAPVREGRAETPLAREAVVWLQKYSKS